MAEEIGSLKNELIAAKAAHAALHQSTVDAGGATTRTVTDVTSRVSTMEAAAKPLIEPKEIVVEVFSGSVADARSKFVAWTKKVKDCIYLYSPEIVEAMKSVERKTTVTAKEDRTNMGVSAQANKELQSFLKDRTGSTAGSLVRNKKDRVGFES